MERCKALNYFDFEPGGKELLYVPVFIGVHPCAIRGEY